MRDHARARTPESCARRAHLGPASRWRARWQGYSIAPLSVPLRNDGAHGLIDAMDLLYAGNPEGFVIVSSDSDYTRLATRLRESGMTGGARGVRTAAAQAQASPFRRDQEYLQGQRMVQPRRSRLVPGQEPCRVRCPRLRPPQARGTRPRPVVRRIEGRAQPGRPEPAVVAHQVLTGERRRPSTRVASGLARLRRPSGP